MSLWARHGGAPVPVERLAQSDIDLLHQRYKSV
jgi:hypothetical protein